MAKTALRLFVLSSCLVLTVFLATYGVLAAVCQGRVEVNYVPIEQWDPARSPSILYNKLTVPAESVQGRDPYPAERPGNFKRVHYAKYESGSINMMLTSGGEAEGQEKVDSDEIFVSYLGAGDGFKAFSEIYSRLFDGGFSIQDSVFTNTEKTQPSHSNLDGYSIHFETEGITGSVVVFSFKDASCKDMSLVKYHIALKTPKA